MVRTRVGAGVRVRGAAVRSHLSPPPLVMIPETVQAGPVDQGKALERLREARQRLFHDPG